MIGDSDLAVAKFCNMLPAEEPGTSEGRTAATNATVRSVFIAGSVSDDDAKKLFPGGWKAPKPYLRITKQPG